MFGETTMDSMQIEVDHANEEIIYKKIDKNKGVVVIKNAFKVNMEALVKLGNSCINNYAPEKGKQFKNHKTNPNSNPNLYF